MEKDDDGVLGDQLQTDHVEYHTSRPRKTEDLRGRGGLILDAADTHSSFLVLKCPKYTVFMRC